MTHDNILRKFSFITLIVVIIISSCARNSKSFSIINMTWKIVEIVVIGSGNKLCSPCGGCRQRLREFSKLDVPIHMCNIGGHIKTSTLGELLPDSFGPENL